MDDATSTTQVGETRDGAVDGTVVLHPRKDWRTFLRWSVCAVTATLAHGAIATLVLDWQSDAVAPTAAIVIELSPVVTAPEVLEMDTPPAPDLVEPETPSDKVVEKDIEERPKAVEETFEPRMIEPSPEPTPEIAPPQPRQANRAVDVQPLEATSRPTPVAVIEWKSEAELAPPQRPNDSKVIDADARAHRPTAQPKPAKPAPGTRKKQARDQIASKPQAADVRQAAAAPAPAASTRSNSNALPNWKSEIVGILQRNKHYPAGEQGVSTLAFSLNREGRVTSARIAASSGSATLDAETLALVHRVQPFPPPPPEVSGAQIPLIVPIHYYHPP